VLQEPGSEVRIHKNLNYTKWKGKKGSGQFFRRRIERLRFCPGDKQCVEIGVADTLQKIKIRQEVQDTVTTRRRGIVTNLQLVLLVVGLVCLAHCVVNDAYLFQNQLDDTFDIVDAHILCNMVMIEVGRIN